MVIEAELLAIREGDYVIYVFKNITNGGLVMCTKPPNWQTPDITIGEKGYLKYEIVEAGQSYYNPQTDTMVKYKYTNVYYTNFVNKSEVIDNKIIL